MSVLKYFKNIPRSPPIGRQALSVIFFFKFTTRSLAKKRACRPAQGRQGPVARWGGDRVPTRMLTLFSFLYFLKIKISKIYVRFEIFQKYLPVAPHRATGPKCNFFL